MERWVNNTFNQKHQLYEKIFLPSQSETEIQTQFIVDYTNIRLDNPIIDICCGSGRHVFSLQKRGFHADGIDISPISVSEATKKGELLLPDSYHPKLYTDDVSMLPIKHPEMAERYSLATNLFSSFGYYQSDKEQVTFLQGVRHVLEPQGKFLIDLPNKHFILENFDKESAFKIDNLNISIKRRYNPQSSRVKTKTTIRDGDIKEVINIEMTTYTYPEITALLEESGFSIEKVARDFSGQEFHTEDASCKRMLILAKKI